MAYAGIGLELTNAVRKGVCRPASKPLSRSRERGFKAQIQTMKTTASATAAYFSP